jgi:hypothetical protein
MSNKEQGREAFKKFLAERFAWGKDPKNPHQKKTTAWAEWKAGYDAELVAWILK